MIRLLKMLVLLPIAVLVVLFAVANRDVVTLSFDPVSPAPVFRAVLPLYAIVFIAVALGMLLGGSAAWLAQARYRRGHRHQRREAERLRAESERLREAVARARENAPALPAPRA